MNNTAENDFFGFPEVKWLHLTDEVDKSVAFYAKFSQDLTRQKSLKSVNFWVIQKIIGDRFWDMVYVNYGHAVGFWGVINEVSAVPLLLLLITIINVF